MGNYLPTTTNSNTDGERSSTSIGVEEPALSRDEPIHVTRIPQRKRRHLGSNDCIIAEAEEVVEDVSPKRKHLKTTSSYIYETLYKQGTGSDLTIRALGTDWKLHKIYLQQAGYFSSMFSGRWKESTESVITMDIPDNNITIDSLDVVFGSLYKDNVELDKTKMLSIVATATMLQMDGLLQVCQDFMKETLCSDTVIDYLDTANLYSLTDITRECMFWLSVHLLTSFNVQLLKQISSEQMVSVITSPDLFVMQVEMDLYTLAKKWLFLQLQQSWSGSLSELSPTADDHFKKSLETNGTSFLDRPEGAEYVDVFRSLRLPNILTDSASVSMIESDGIIPPDWLLLFYRQQWLKMVQVEQRMDVGPHLLNDEIFKKHAVRCGRILATSNEYCWRWTGYSFGVDILLIYCNGLISIKRNTHSQPCMASVSLQTARQITFRLRLVSFKDSSESIIASNQDTGILRLSLGQDEGHHVMTLSKDAQFPLYISFYFSLISCNETLPHE